MWPFSKKPKLPKYRVVQDFNGRYYCQFRDGRYWVYFPGSNDTQFEAEERLKKLIERLDFKPVVIVEYY